jgi:cell division septation protein DedD
MRRNWPDLLIGLALIAVIAGIVATLLTGGSFFPLGGNDASQPAAAPPSATSPAAPGDSAPSAPAVGDADEPADGPSVAILPPTDTGTETDAATDGGSLAATPPGAPDPATVEDATPSSSTVQPVAPGAPSSPGAAEAADDSAPATAEPVPASPDATAAPSAAASPPAPLPTDPYRVSVGAFGSPDNAEALADRVRADGFPVFLASQGSLTLVLVGPYERLADAESAAERIRQGDYGVDPIIYTFEGDEDGADAASSAADETPVPEPAPAAAEPAPAPAVLEPASPAPGAVRLQVGAYGDRAGAEPQIERLENLGFDVDVLDEDGLVKLVVGPFAGSALDDARIVLDGAGIEFFAR